MAFIVVHKLYPETPSVKYEVEIVKIDNLQAHNALAIKYNSPGVAFILTIKVIFYGSQRLTLRGVVSLYISYFHNMYFELNVLPIIPSACQGEVPSSNMFILGSHSKHFANPCSSLDANCGSIFFNIRTNIEPQHQP